MRLRLEEEAGGFLEAAETEPDQWRVVACTTGLRATLTGHSGCTY